MSPLANKRLVIFGCGYVGSAVARAAVAAGVRVEALTRNPVKAAALREIGIDPVVIADLASTAWYRQFAPAPDFVVNTVSSGGPDQYWQSYVVGMQSILSWAASAGPIGRMVYTSSTSVYPQGDGAVVDETAWAPGATPNGRIISESEVLLKNAPSAVERRFILRLAGIYGPARHHLLDQLRTGTATLSGSGEHRLNLAQRDDIVAAILACLQASDAIKSEIYNVADLAPARRADVVAWLCARLGRPVPAFDGSTTARRDGAPMPDRIISSAKLQRELGWRPKYADFKAGFGEILGTTNPH